MIFRKVSLVMLLLVVAMGYAQADKVKKENNKRRAEAKEGENRFKKWLEEDVVYIITPEERDVFKKLTTTEEREKFIDLFWLRRDPSPGTSENEFKEEHYRRIAYANEHFASGIPGWKTDRGRIYIMFGKPDNIESHPSGGSYQRPYYEGGGTTSTYPFELWRYRYIPGVGQDVEIEFVDKSMSGEYRMALSPDEKDALLHVPGAGLTWDEEMGLSTKADRLTRTADSSRMYGQRLKDMPFERLAQYVNLQRPPEIKFKDLQAVVTTKVTYNQLPLQFRTDLIRLNKESFLVPITLELNNGDLQFKKEYDIYRGAVNVYGSITSVTGRVEREFEDVITTDYLEGEIEKGKQKRSVYQKLVSLKPGLYKLDLVVKDINSGSMSVFKRSFTVPKQSEDNLIASSLILATAIQPIKNLLVAQREHFVLGDLKVIPNVQAQYKKDENLNVYLQVYNTAIDQAKLTPSVKVEYSVLKGDQVVKKIEDTEGKSIQFFSAQRLVLVESIPLSGLSPGDYKVRVGVTDNISNKSVSTESNFKVVESTPALSNLKSETPAH